MCRISVMSSALISISLVAIAGCLPLGVDNGGDGENDTTPTTIDGTWSGTLDCTRTFSYPSQPGTPLPCPRELAITFNSEYVPTSLPVWGFYFAFDQTTQKNAQGESETFSFEANSPYRDVTLTVTIIEATYNESSANVVMNLEYSATSSQLALTEQGTGTMTIEATIDGNSLNFSGIAQYNITQTNAAAELTVEATETTNCTGTLTKQ